MDIDFVKYGSEVKKIRKDLDLTQEVVYNCTGVSIETLRRLEKGLQEPKISTLEKLTSFYKFDLLNLLLTCRNQMNFFSDDIIKSINYDLRMYNYTSLKGTINRMINHFLDKVQDSSHENAKLYLTRYLQVFNDMEFANSRDMKKNIVNVENFLLFLNNNKKGIGADKYLYELEVSSILCLIVFYKQNMEFDKAIHLSINTINTLKAYTTYTKRQLNHIGALYLNLAYLYHRIDLHEKVIETINEVLNNSDHVFSNHLYNELMVRKAISFYNLKNPQYKALLTSAILNSSETQKETICKVIKSNYDMDHDLCNIVDNH